MSKIFLIGITSNEKDNIDEMTRDIYQYFDGLIFVEHQSNDGTRELLESRKGAGEIITLPWMNHHSWSMNACLNSEKINEGDYFLLLDSSERLAVNFAQNIRSLIEELAFNNINAVFHYSKLVIAKYTPDVHFILTPHWGFTGWTGRYLVLENVPKFNEPQNCIYSTRNGKRPREHFLNHFIKYYIRKVSNHLLLGREDKQQEYQEHEQIRRKFRDFCLNTLGIKELNLQSFTDYFTQNKELEYRTKWFFNYEPILNNWYCYYILNHDVDQIIERANKNEIFEIK